MLLITTRGDRSQRPAPREVVQRIGIDTAHHLLSFGGMVSEGGPRRKRRPLDGGAASGRQLALGLGARLGAGLTEGAGLALAAGLVPGAGLADEPDSGG